MIIIKDLLEWWKGFKDLESDLEEMSSPKNKNVKLQPECLSNSIQTI